MQSLRLAKSLGPERGWKDSSRFAIQPSNFSLWLNLSMVLLSLLHQRPFHCWTATTRKNSMSSHNLPLKFSSIFFFFSQSLELSRKEQLPITEKSPLHIWRWPSEFQDICLLRPDGNMAKGHNSLIQMFFSKGKCFYDV